MAFIEMLSDASLLNLLTEMLMIEILRGDVPQLQLQCRNLLKLIFYARKCATLPSVFTFSTLLANL